MLPFKSRLTKRKDFESLYKKGSFFSFKNIALKAMPNERPETRIGIAVGLKFSKKAVERNQMKRQIREALRKNLGKIKKGYDVVVMVRRKEGEKIKGQDIEGMLAEAFSRASLIN